ncbi:hypothetical protein CRUP_000573 [Coryphaenoides rupestris]|nr:hypothetical protein CRUP_000573 [Coryphaenoides rupestris]
MMSQEAEPAQETPPTHDLLGLLLRNRRPPSAVSQVWPGLYIADVATAKDKDLLGTLGVTHVLNAADGPNHIDTGACFYGDTDIVYYGVAAADHKGFDLSPFFGPVSEFIRDGLAQNGAGALRQRCQPLRCSWCWPSSCLRERMSLVDAITAVCRHRNILPNLGFLRQLHLLDTTLQASGRSRT